MIEGLDLKKNILKEIMDMMDAKEGDRLKKHPKFMKAEIEIGAKPKEDEMMDDKEDKPEIEMDPKLDAKEDVAEGEMDDIDPEMLQMLIEKMKEMK